MSKLRLLSFWGGTEYWVKVSGLEVAFPPDKIADVANVIGNDVEGIKCLSLDRPAFDNSFWTFAIEAMDRLGFAFYDDALGSIHVLHGDPDDLPESIRSESVNGVHKISSFSQIWQKL